MQILPRFASRVRGGQVRSRERCIAIVRRGIQRREDTILSAVDKREGEFSRAENETGGDEKEREGGEKKQERGKYRQKTVKAQLRGQNAGEKKEQQVGEKNIAARRAVAKNARLPEGTGR